MAHYYGYRLVDTDGPEVLAEHGFLTNPDERKWLKAHVHELAEAHYRALCKYFDITPLPA
jgi:N-acetylmuramoyl-L-alanine amidase